jgi:Protein of unknown function (DUF3443)
VSKPSFSISLAAAVLCIAMTLSACGGGGGGGGGGASGATASGSTSTAQATSTTSSTSTSTQTTPTPSATQKAPNVATVTVDSGLTGVPNMPFVTITVCQPGTSNCQSIDHVLVDTGSWGLRVFASQLPGPIALPQETDASSRPIAECMQFFDGYTWGAVRLADVHIAGETASSLPIQVIDPNYASIPSDCASIGPAKNTPSALAANGILGIGVFLHDCGGNCAAKVLPATYYTCAGGSCTNTAMPEALQVANPVPYFAGDNNGVIVQLPDVSAAGAQSTTGSLIFGIGTQANNAVGTAKVLPVSTANGRFTTVFNGTAYSLSLIDSGSTALFFASSALPACANPNPSYYCPTSTATLNATTQGADGSTGAISFTVANANALATEAAGYAVLPSLAGSAFVNSTVFDWGLPFFYGKSVYAAIETKGTPSGTGPYFAY